MAQAFPATFTTLQATEPRPVPIRIRDDLDQETGAEVVEAIRAVGWPGLVHAYGAATDVEDQLIAAAVGDEATRKAAWWDLWGNIHHQGTIYEATAAAVPLIGRLAAWRSYPDRPEAISFLRQVVAAEGVVVWSWNDQHEMVFDVPRQQKLAADLGQDVRDLAHRLVSRWRDEPESVRRTLLWLLSGLPGLEGGDRELIDTELPERFQSVWPLLSREPNSQAEFDRVCEFEEWAYPGSSS